MKKRSKGVGLGGLGPGPWAWAWWVPVSDEEDASHMDPVHEPSNPKLNEVMLETPTIQPET